MEDPFDRTPGPPPGTVVEVAPGVRRVTAPNPSPMTFEGTQTYLVGEGDVVVIDPGPDDAAHADAVLAALRTDERVTQIVVTHTHLDHSAGAPRLRARTGAATAGFGRHGVAMSERMRALADAADFPAGGEGADRAFVPERPLAEGDVIEAGDRRLGVLHVPGHLSNHIALDLDGLLFTGDTVMAWATTMVSPPEGDMAAFLATLERLAARADRAYLPGHGPVLDNPGRMLRHQIAHRERRLGQIAEALAAGPATLAGLRARIYAGLDPRLERAAERNVFSGLLVLEERGEAVSAGNGVWQRR